MAAVHHNVRKDAGPRLTSQHTRGLATTCGRGRDSLAPTHIFSEVFGGARRLLATFFSPAMTTPSAQCTPTAAAALLMACMAYSTWNRRPAVGNKGKAR